MATERFIENNVIRNRGLLGYTDSVFIRRCRAGRRRGIVDVMMLPLRGPHKIVLIEAKRSTSDDAHAKVIGQLLLYYAGALELGQRGLRHLKQFATVHPVRARSTKPIMLKSLTGGISLAQAAWDEMKKGRKLRPDQIKMYVALDAPPPEGLKSALNALAAGHGLSIGVVSVVGRDKLNVWNPD